MSYILKIDSFEGPFELLLYLVSKQKVDIGSISISQITDQYLDEVNKMRDLNLDIASDFIMVAATLLEIKALSLLPKDKDEEVEDFEDLSPNEAREILAFRLIEYKKYKNSAAYLSQLFDENAKLHTRNAGPEARFYDQMPDFLKNVSLDALGVICATALARREEFLLDSAHIASKPLSLEVHVKAIYSRVKNNRSLKFSSLFTGNSPAPELVVVNFLAVLELYKRCMIRVVQAENFGDLDIEYIPDAPSLIIDEKNALTSIGMGE